MNIRSRKLIVLIVLLLFVSINISAGWERTYGGATQDEAYSVQQTSDSGYIIVGNTNSFGAGNYDVYLIKTTNNGDTLWTQTYGDVNDDYGRSVQQTTDKGYIIVGSTWLDGNSSEVYLIKTDSFGDTIWTKHYGGVDYDVGYSVKQTMDEGYIISGGYNVFGGHNDGDVYLIKTDSLGDTVWTRTYDGNNYLDEAFSVQQTYDGGYIVAGRTDTCFSWDEFLLLKIDSNGDSIWSKIFGDQFNDIAFSVQQTNDSGFVIAGWTGSDLSGVAYYYLVKTDKYGDSIWSRKYGGNWENRCYSVSLTDDHGFILVGFMEQYLWNHDVFLVKTDSIGNLLWSRTFGGNDYDRARCVQQTYDGGYIIVGKTVSYGMGSWDYYLIKTDSLGLLTVNESLNIEEDCFIYSINQISNNNISLQFTLSENSNVELRIYDISGRCISTPINNNYLSGVYNVNFKLENSGVYFYNIITTHKSNYGKLTIF